MTYRLSSAAQYGLEGYVKRPWLEKGFYEFGEIVFGSLNQTEPRT
jgi:hypothetical protein